MKRTVIVLFVLLGGGLAVSLWANRCIRKPAPRNGTLQVCYRWFVPRYVVDRDKTDRIVGYVILDGSGFTAVPERTLWDLFGSGRISEVKAFSRLPNGTWLERTGISTRDDGRLDLVLEVEGLSHPMDGHPVSLYRIARDGCRSWRRDTYSVPGKTIEVQSCQDESARRPINPLEAKELVQSLPIIQEREWAILQRFRTVHPSS